MTDLISALTAGVSERAVPWMYQRTMPPLVKMVNRSNMFCSFDSSNNDDASMTGCLNNFYLEHTSGSVVHYDIILIFFLNLEHLSLLSFIHSRLF